MAEYKLDPNAGRFINISDGERNTDPLIIEAIESAEGVFSAPMEMSESLLEVADAFIEPPEPVMLVDIIPKSNGTVSDVVVGWNDIPGAVRYEAQVVKV